MAGIFINITRERITQKQIIYFHIFGHLPFPLCFGLLSFTVPGIEVLLSFKYNNNSAMDTVQSPITRSGYNLKSPLFSFQSLLTKSSRKSLALVHCYRQYNR